MKSLDASTVLTPKSLPHWVAEFKKQDNFQYYRTSYLKIKTKEATLIPFRPNSAQLILEKAIEDQRREGKPVRLIVLKARQEGISTDVSAMIFHDTAIHENRRSQVIAHDPETTKGLFDMYKTYYDNLPVELKPLQRYNNQTSLVFENPDPITRPARPGLRSSIHVATANKVKGGRGLTVHNFHASEVAFWPNARELMVSFKQAIPDNKKTMIFLESTANGDDPYFKENYFAAKKGLTDYKAVFIPWFAMYEYRRDASEIDTPLDDYEKHLIATFGVGKDQLAWRRWAIKNKCDGDIKMFMQEYPATDIEAFQKKSGLVYPEFDERIHVVPHFNPDPNEYVFIGGYDFGAVHPTAYVLFGVDKEGVVYQFAEFKRVGTTFEEQSAIIKEMERGLHISRRYRGHDSGATQAEVELKKYGVRLAEGIVHREAGITTLRGLLRSGKYVVSDRCVNTIYEFKNHVHKTDVQIREDEGVIKSDGDPIKDAAVLKKDDDCLDALRYGITTYLKVRPKPVESSKEKLVKKVQRELRLKKQGKIINW